MNTETNEAQFERIKTILNAIEMNYNTAEDNSCLITGLHHQDLSINILIIPMEEYWTSLTTFGLCEKIMDDDAAMAKFYKTILRENDYSKLGKFYITDDNRVEFSVDLRNEDLSEELIAIALDLIGYISFEIFPNLITPFAELLYDKTNVIN